MTLPEFSKLIIILGTNIKWDKLFKYLKNGWDFIIIITFNDQQPDTFRYTLKNKQFQRKFE